MTSGRMRRIGLVVHPRRPIDGALGTLRGWCEAHDVDLVQIRVAGQDREVADRGDAGGCDLIVALGGDGTTLAAVHAAAPHDVPVLGVACGSLGALTATGADELTAALDQIDAGGWFPRRMPGLAIATDGAATRWAVNDVVLIRDGAGQVAADVRVDGELYVRFAGDGCVVATSLGSSAYTLAAGGPVLAMGTTGLVVTPIAPHGGCCPPLVTGRERRIEIALDPGYGGARIEVDGRIDGHVEALTPRTFTVTLRDDYATLVALGDEEPMLTGLRRRGVLADSPRIVARDHRSGLPREA